ncbi:MAG: hypothetical protein Q4A78_01285 [Peptostreptococcaceae bacterium]|nr:hypothetical protein [Peptostreptococcaceae bacterium]
MGELETLLIGKRQEAAESYLRERGLSFETKLIRGGKDEALLKESHVIRATVKGESWLLVCSLFKTDL